MGSLNKVILVGRMGQDPEMRVTGGGVAVCNISVATDSSWTDKNTKEKREKTEWHKVVLFGRQAEIMGEHGAKGSLVAIEGELETQQWEKDGQKHYTTQIKTRDFQFLGPKPDREQSQGYQQPASQQANEDKPPFDDDIPF